MGDGGIDISSPISTVDEFVEKFSVFSALKTESVMGISASERELEFPKDLSNLRDLGRFYYHASEQQESALASLEFSRKALGCAESLNITKAVGVMKLNLVKYLIESHRFFESRKVLESIDFNSLEDFDKIRYHVKQSGVSSRLADFNGLNASLEALVGFLNGDDFPADLLGEVFIVLLIHSDFSISSSDDYDRVVSQAMSLGFDGEYLFYVRSELLKKFEDKTSEEYLSCKEEFELAINNAYNDGGSQSAEWILSVRRSELIDCEADCGQYYALVDDYKKYPELKFHEAEVWVKGFFLELRSVNLDPVILEEKRAEFLDYWLLLERFLGIDMIACVDDGSIVGGMKHGVSEMVSAACGSSSFVKEGEIIKSGHGEFVDDVLNVIAILYSDYEGPFDEARFDFSHYHHGSYYFNTAEVKGNDEQFFSYLKEEFGFSGVSIIDNTETKQVGFSHEEAVFDTDHNSLLLQSGKVYYKDKCLCLEKDAPPCLIDDEFSHLELLFVMHCEPDTFESDGKVDDTGSRVEFLKKYLGDMDANSRRKIPMEEIPLVSRYEISGEDLLMPANNYVLEQMTALIEKQFPNGDSQNFPTFLKEHDPQICVCMVGNRLHSFFSIKDVSDEENDIDIELDWFNSNFRPPVRGLSAQKVIASMVDDYRDKRARTYCKPYVASFSLAMDNGFFISGIELDKFKHNYLKLEWNNENIPDVSDEVLNNVKDSYFDNDKDSFFKVDGYQVIWHDFQGQDPAADFEGGFYDSIQLGFNNNDFKQGVGSISIGYKRILIFK